MKRFKTWATLAICSGVSLGAHAVSIADLDLSKFAFDVTTYDVGSNAAGVGGDATASGTSGETAWRISPTSVWAGRTTTNGTFRFRALPLTTDSLHPGLDYTISFSAPVKLLLVALSNDNLTDSINFGLSPVDTVGLSVTGTQLTLNSPVGGLALFDNVNAMTVRNTNSNGIDDGYDLAFWAVTVVPEPSAMALLVCGFAALGMTQWRNKRLSVKQP